MSGKIHGEREQSALSGAPGPDLMSDSQLQLRGKGLDEQLQMLAPDADLGAQANIQLQGGGGTEGVHQAAAHGISGSGGALPHLDAIQTSFGHHDVGHVQAHTERPPSTGWSTTR